ncbi:MAG: glycoside hydrolase family 5 protein [Bacteroidota bacterium]|nr:glycoside hydrolase family 5 protein [Bacteroidota bacterium]
MRTWLLILLFLFIALISVEAQSKQFFHARGKEIISPSGKPFLIKGTNLGNWLVPEGYMFKLNNATSPRLINEAFTELIGSAEMKVFWQKFVDNYITAADIHYLKKLGMNSIRVPFNYRLFTIENYLGQNNDLHGFELFDRLIQWCKKEQLYVILDMHCAPGGQTGDNIDDGVGYPFLFDSPADLQLTSNIWTKIAQRYSKENIILGYDLLNEPIAHFFDSAHFNPLLEPAYKMIVAAIRTVDKNHLIFLGGSQWDSNFRPFGKPFDNNLAYTFHKYWTPPVKAVVQDYIDFRDKYNVPIYLGESGENTYGWIDSFRTVCEQNNIGWHFWPYKKIDNTRGIVSFDVPAGYDSVIFYADAPKKNFQDIRDLTPKNVQATKAALNKLLENVLFQNCHANAGYIKALGFDYFKVE